MPQRWGYIVLLLSYACGGGTVAAPNAEPSSASTASAPDDAGFGDLPAWVRRGNVALGGDEQRVFYGVGTANGIKNPALLRATADDRARNELGKVFEVFSASLMKDYAASSGAQHVEQAVKTFTSLSLEGSDIIDRYVAGDGTLYALAALDIDRVTASVKEAIEKGVVTPAVESVNLEEIFDAHAQKAIPPARVAKLAGESRLVPPAEVTSGAVLASGPKPSWVDGEDPRFAWDRFLCATGFGPERTHAESGAYAALAKIFIANVRSASRDFMGAYASTGAPSLEMQSSETLTQVSTQKLLSGVRIPEIWRGEDALYALACLERIKASKGLRDRISELDGQIESLMSKAREQDAAGRVRELSRALEALVQRAALNQELRIVDYEGVGVPAAVAHVDVVAALEGAVLALRVGIRADGPYDGDLRGALVDALTAKGYKVNDNPDDVDVLVSSTIRMEDGGAGTGSAKSLRFVRAVIQVEVKNVAAGKVIGSFNESRKEGHRSREEAERKAVRELAKKLSAQVGDKIDDTMKGRR